MVNGLGFRVEVARVVVQRGQLPLFRGHLGFDISFNLRILVYLIIYDSG